MFPVLGNRPVSNIPGSLKNNSAITITSKTGPRPGFHRVMRPSIIGQNKMRPMMPGQKIADIRSRLGELRAYSSLRPKSPLQGRLLRPNLPGSVSITKIPREPKKTETDGNESGSTSKMEVNSDEDTQVLDSDEEEDNKPQSSKPSSDVEQDKNKSETPESSKPIEEEQPSTTPEQESKPEPEPLVLTTDEKLPSEDVLENKTIEDNNIEQSKAPDMSKLDATDLSRTADAVERKINPLKNYRHQRPGGRPSLESSLSQLERTASVLNKEGMPDFRRNLDDITQSYSPTGEEKPGAKTKKRRSPAKPDAAPEPTLTPPAPVPMPHSVSSLLGPAAPPRVRKPSPVPHVPHVPHVTHAPHASHAPLASHAPHASHTPHAPLASSHAPLASSHAPLASSHAPLASSHAPLASSHAPHASSHAPHASSHAPHASSHAPHASHAPHPAPHAAPVSPLDSSQHLSTHPRLMPRSHEPQPLPHASHMKSSPGMPLSLSHPAMMSGGTAVPADLSKSPVPGPMSHGPPGPPVPPGQAYPVGNPPPDGPYAQYPGKTTYPVIPLVFPNEASSTREQ